MKSLLVCLVALLACSTFSWAANGFLAGSGTKQAPYLVEDYADLSALAGYGLDKCYRLTKDIDASASLTDHHDSGFSPISYNEAKAHFTGSFAGGGHAIRNLTINRSGNWYMGLFGYLGAGSTVDSLALIDVTIRGYKHVGGLAAQNDGTIRHCSVSGSVWALSEGGMLVGTSRGVIDHASTSGSIYGLGQDGSSLGGLVGSADSGVVSNSRSSARVLDGSFSGGLVGVNGGLVVNCHASGLVGNTDPPRSFDFVGGLIGSNSAVVDSCYATGNVASTGKYVGGLIGSSQWFYGMRHIGNSYATGSVSGYGYVGGLVGGEGDTIRCSYAIGQVVGDDGDYVGGFTGAIASGAHFFQCYAAGEVSGSLTRTNMGGFAGQMRSGSSVSSSYWDRARSRNARVSIADTIGVIPQVAGLSTDSMMRSSSFVGWSFSEAGPWKIVEGKSYPALRGMENPPIAFDDTLASGKAFLLSRLTELAYGMGFSSDLVVQAESLSLGTLNKGLIGFPDSSTKGDSLRVVFRIGKVLSVGEDTLWGNRAQAVLILDPSVAADGLTTRVEGHSTSACMPASAVVSGFGSTLRASYTQSRQGRAIASLYDLRGRCLARSDLGFRSAGVNWVEFDVKAGTYFLRVVLDNQAVPSR